MSAALLAGRSRLKTLVVNGESPRNAVAHASHGFFTRDGAHSSELLAIAKAQLETYPSVSYRVGEVASAERAEEGFVVTGRDGAEWRAERLMLATGYRTELASIGVPGLEAVWGRSVFPCPFCDGFERADQRFAVFASEMLPFASVVANWSKDVVVFTNGREYPEDVRDALVAKGIPVETGAIRELRSEEGKLRAVVLEDGREVARDAGFVGEEHAVPATDLAERLGVPTTTNDWGMTHFDADDFGKTSVPGVYVVGDMKRVFGGIPAAVHDGYLCVAGIVHERTLGH